MKLKRYAKQYFLERDLAAATESAYLNTIRVFRDWLGRKPQLEDLSDQMLNKFIETLLRQENSRWTTKTRRSHMIALARSAFDAGLSEYLPKRVKPVRVPRPIVDVWSVDEIQLLFDTAGRLRGTIHGTSLEKARVCQALVAIAWDTALRRSDLYRIELGWIRESVLFTIVQQKSQRTKICRLNQSTRELILSIGDESRQYALPRWGNVTRLSKLAKAAMELAGLSTSRGQVLHKIRKSSITHVETIEKGAGWVHGGHANADITNRHYISAEAAYADMPTPVSIAG